MDDQKAAPVTVSIVGSGETSGGGVAPTPSGTVATTPDGQPNLVVNVITPLVAIGVRFVKTFLVTALGVLTAAGFGAAAFKFTDFHGVLVAASLAGVSSAGIDLVKNLITVFGRLEGKYPLLTGSI